MTALPFVLHERQQQPRHAQSARFLREQGGRRMNSSWRFAFQGLRTTLPCDDCKERPGLPSPPAPHSATDDHALKPGGSRSARFASQKLGRRGVAYHASGSSARNPRISLLLFTVR